MTPPGPELEWARRAAFALGTRHRERRISGREVGGALPQISGEGANEVFGGS